MNNTLLPTEKLDIFLVGGAVRDLMMGDKPSDRDWVIVGAGPLEIEQLQSVEGFEKVGAHFPVFLDPRNNEEYALARTERKVDNGYHGFEVFFDSDVTIEEDLLRRDLTINAMAYAVKPQEYSSMKFDAARVIDPYGGKHDLQNKVLRHTSAAFVEDPLRVIRLARFAARFADFTIAPETMELAREMVRTGQLNELPKERFTAEINKVLRTIQPQHIERFFHVLAELSCSKYVDFFKGFDLYRAGACAKHIASDLMGDLNGADVLSIICASDNAWVGSVFNQHVKKAHECFQYVQRQDTSLNEAALYIMKQTGWGASTNAFGLLVSALTYWPSRLPVSTVLRASAATLPLNSVGEQLRGTGMNGKKIGELIYSARVKALNDLMFTAHGTHA